MKKVAFHTLGCKVNTYDTEAMMEIFEHSGYETVSFNDKANIYVINTCTVTSMGDKKSRQMIRKAKHCNEEAIIIVTGCYAQTSPGELQKIPEVNLIIGNQDRKNIVKILEGISNNEGHKSYVKDIMSTKEYEELKITKVKGRTRAFIKVQEGCNQFCSYCIIPYARGPVRSRKLNNILSEAKEIASKGYKEIVVTGINISAYGKDTPNIGLLDVLLGLNEIEGIERIRLSSLEPMILSEEFIDGLQRVDKLCDHFHLSLQSGSDKVLKEMNRKYNKNDFKNIVDRLRCYYPDCSITTDVMVGFPGENQEEFMECYNYIEKIEFSKLHVFKYSKREGTQASKRNDQIPEKIKEERSKILLSLSDRLEEEYHKKFITKELQVLFEQRSKDKDNYYHGHSKNYLLVEAYSTDDIVNMDKNVFIKCIGEGSLSGVIK